MEGVRAKVRRLELTNERSPLWAWEPTAPFTVLTVSGDTIEFPPYSVPARSVQLAVAYSVKLPGLGRIPWTIALRLRTQEGIYDLLVEGKGSGGGEGVKSALDSGPLLLLPSERVPHCPGPLRHTPCTAFSDETLAREGVFLW